MVFERQHTTGGGGIAQVHFTLDHEEIKSLFLGNRDESMVKVPQIILNHLLKAEATEQIGAQCYKRSDDRTTYSIWLSSIFDPIYCKSKIIDCKIRPSLVSPSTILSSVMFEKLIRKVFS